MDKGVRNLIILVSVVGFGLTILYFVDKNKKGNKKPIKGGVTAENKQNKISFTRG